MKDIYIIGKQPSIAVIGNSLNKSVNVKRIIEWNESIRLTSNTWAFEKSDYVILAFNNRKLSMLLRRWLIEVFQLSDHNIVDYSDIVLYELPLMHVDRIFEVYDDDYYQGIVLGLSHARVGICPEMIPINVADISVSAQDIYYNYSTLKYIISQYPTRLKNIQYAVYDVFDYTYLNYDVSLSNNACQYYKWGGYSLDSHNFNLNKNCDVDFDEFISGIQSNKLKTGVEHFSNECIIRGDFIKQYNKAEVDMIGSRTKTVSPEEILAYDGDNSLVNKRFESTIKENIELLNKTMELLKSINPNMKIRLVILPHYPQACRQIESKYKDVKKKFLDRMNVLCETWDDVEFYDLKELPEFENELYFYDCEHLNYFGAIKFTNILNAVMQW